MARTEITQQQAVGGPLVLTPTALDPTNGMIVTQTNALGSDVKGCKLLLRVKNTTAAVKLVTIKATDRKLQRYVADLAVSMSAASEALVGPLDRERFLRDDHTYWVDVEAAATGDVAAIWIR